MSRCDVIHSPSISIWTLVANGSSNMACSIVVWILMLIFVAPLLGNHRRSSRMGV